MTTVIVSEETIDIITIGTQGPQGATGATGATGAAGAAGQGVPTGGTTGQTLRKASNSNYDTEWATAGAGSVTTVSVASANGFAGSVANATSTPAITVSTSITGLLKGNGTAISAASSGTDYLAPNSSITGATKTKVTYDAKGLVTAGADATTSDISEGSNLYYTDERAQDATGAMVDSSLVYVDATPLLTRAALTGDITASQGSNATTLATVNSNVGSFTNASITVNAKGLVTAASSGTAPATASFTTISVSGQSDVVADSASDTLTLVAGSNVTLTTNAGTDTITIAASGGSGSPGGSNTQLQYNSSGSFAGSSTLTYGSGILNVGSATTSYSNVTVLNAIFATDTGTGNNIAIIKSVTGATGPALLFGKSRGTNASPTVVSSGDTLTNMLFRGYDGTDYQSAATISSAVDGTPGTGDMPGRLTFSTTPDGSSTVSERMRIDCSGNIGIGTTTISARLHTISTTEQHRTGYDTSNYMSKTISSTGGATFNLVGTTPGYTFNSGGTTLLSLDSTGAMYGYIAKLNDQTGTTYTLDTTTDRGKVLTVSNASAITVTLPNSAAVGYCLTVYQKGAGQITFSAASGATLRNRQSHTKVAGQYGTVTLFVESNSGGSAAVWVLAGDTGA